MISTSTLDISKEELNVMWANLYSESHHSFFLSWQWISTWLEQVKHDYIIVQATENNKLVGLCILVKQQKSGLRFFPSTTLFMHRTGDESLDQAWIEYNDILTVSNNANAIKASIVDHICRRLTWNNLVVGASEESAFIPFKLANLIKENVWKNQSYSTDLKKIRDSNLPYIDHLSKNTRYQINRSLRLYQQLGEIRIEFADSVTEALDWFEASAPLHIKRWQHRKVGSGFTNSHFVNFHKRLISHSFDEGKIHIIRISSGDEVFCYLYNFIEELTVRFYLAATKFDESDNKYKPGMLGHYLAITKYIELGYHLYDFMAGESQYKRSLATSSSQVSIARFKRSNLITRAETTLRALKRRIVDRQTQPAISKSQGFSIILTGGTECSENTGKYKQEKIIKLTINSGQASCIASYTHQPNIELPKEANRTFKAASKYKDIIYAVTETEVVKLDANSLLSLSSFSHESFNDLHHVIEYQGSLIVANTGLDNVTFYDPNTQTITHKSATSKRVLNRLNEDVDYRKVPSTKPHITHPNYLFVLDNDIWVTRCDTMDALNIRNPSDRIEIGNNLVHDGVAHGSSIYFTCVDGQLKVFDQQTKLLKHTLLLQDCVPGYNGWCRGVLPLSSNLVILGSSKIRNSKRISHVSRNVGEILLVDIFKKQLLWRIDTSQFGLDCIFSILNGD